MIIGALFLAASPAPLSLEPFMDEEAAAHALESHMFCISHVASEHLNDGQSPVIIGSEAGRTCDQTGTALRKALADVYRRKPQLLAAGENPDEAAQHYVEGMNARVEVVIREERAKKH